MGRWALLKVDLDTWRQQSPAAVDLVGGEERQNRKRRFWGLVDLALARDGAGPLTDRISMSLDDVALVRYMTTVFGIKIAYK